MTRVLFALLSALTFFLVAGAPASMALAAGGEASLQPDDGAGAAAKVAGEVDVDVADKDREGGAWYVSPIWIAIGVLAIGVLVAIIVVASRGGTVIRD